MTILKNPSALIRSALVLAAALLAGALVASAQPGGYGVFYPNGDFELVVDGTEIPEAELYRSTQTPSVLIRSAEFAAPVLVVPGQRRVETVNVMKMAKGDDGSLRLLPNATLEPQGSFRVDGQAVEFTVDGRKVRLQPKPPLLGHQEAADLKEYSHLYVRGAERYDPDAAALSRLGELSEPVRVRIFFGSWCPHCQRHLPAAVRLAEELDSSQVSFDFYGLPRSFKGEPEAEEADVSAVPTGIVYVDGREVGRIESEDWARPERAIYELVRGASSSSR